MTVRLYEDDAPNDGNPDGAAIQTTTTGLGGSFQFDVNLPFSQAFMYNQRIAQPSDDAIQKASATDANNNTLKLGKADANGLRFQGVNIPSGANGQ